MWLMPSHWTYQCVIIVWTITISIHLGKLFLDCKCTTVSSIRLKWEMPYLPGINKQYRSISFYHLTTFWHAQAWKTFVLIYCFRILAAADGRDCVSQLLWTKRWELTRRPNYVQSCFLICWPTCGSVWLYVQTTNFVVPKQFWLYFLLTKKGIWTAESKWIRKAMVPSRLLECKVDTTSVSKIVCSISK
jgi:hypothetical protein